MKRIFLLILIGQIYIFYILPTHILGQEVDIETTISPERLEKIRQIKESVATKVAELREEERTPDLIIGQIEQLKEESFILTNSQGEVTINIGEDTEITLIEGKDRKRITISEVSSGQLAQVVGKRQEKQFLAAEVVLAPKRQILIGKISSIDRPNGQFLLATMAGAVTIDVERTTVTNTYDMESDKISRSGFSKLAVGVTVHIVSRAKDSDLFEALRILVIPQFKEEIPTPTAAEEEE